MYNILQFVILLANVCCIGYFLYQAGKLKGLSMATSAALNHKMDKKCCANCENNEGDYFCYTHGLITDLNDCCGDHISLKEETNND